MYLQTMMFNMIFNTERHDLQYNTCVKVSYLGEIISCSKKIPLSMMILKYMIPTILDLRIDSQETLCHCYMGFIPET